MFRPCSAQLLLAALASPIAAQSGSAGWTLASGEYTIYGHTDYRPTQILVPRVVYDTTRGVDSARTIDSVRVSPARPAGFAAGLSAWPEDLYCTGPASAAMQPLEPGALLARIQVAARCGVRLVIVPPRKRLTADGTLNGLFSGDSARRLIDRYAAALPADTIRKYRATILGLNLADDYACGACWGGTPITQAQIATWAAYARARLRDIPLGVRVTPDWVAASPTLAPLLDYAWAQYHTGKGEAKAYYDAAAAAAARLGLRVVMGVNVENCSGRHTGACTAAELLRFGSLALSHPASCAFLSWRYEAGTWAQADVRQAWEGLLATARARRAEDCRRAPAA